MECAKTTSYDSLMRAYCATRDLGIRNKLLDKYMYIAHIAAKKFAGRGIEYDDLLQTAYLALIKALERFDCARDVKFSTFATPCVIGEIKNYFRDKSRLIRMPRRNSEMLKRMDAAYDELIMENSAIPNPDQVAARIGESVELVQELMEMRAHIFTLSLDEMVTSDSGGPMNISDIVGEDEPAYAQIENADFFQSILKELSPTESEILVGRFLKNKSQREVADGLGVSQMYVSRLERKLTQRLRSFL